MTTEQELFEEAAKVFGNYTHDEEIVALALRYLRSMLHGMIGEERQCMIDWLYLDWLDQDGEISTLICAIGFVLKKEGYV